MSRSHSPAELQAQVLEGLLLRGHQLRKADQVVQSELPTDEIVPRLVEIFSAVFRKFSLTVSNQCKTNASEWLANLVDETLILVLEFEPSDEAPVCLEFPFDLVQDYLAVSLGGQPGKANNRGNIGQMELKLMHTLVPAFSNAILPLVRSSPCNSSIRFGTEVRSVKIATDLVSHKVEFALGSDGSSYSIGIAIPEKRVERRSVDTSKPETDRIAGFAAAEVENSLIRVDVFVKLKDMALGQLNDLTVGSVIPLKLSHLQRAKLKVRGNELLEGQVGRVSEIFSFKVSSPSRRPRAD